MTSNINNSPEFACQTCTKQKCGCKDSESPLRCHFYTEQDHFRGVTKMVQKPIGYVIEDDSGYTGSMIYANKGGDCFLPVYLSPVHIKDLTDDEIAQAVGSPLDEVYLADFRAVIAADREKNK